jgi:ABC-type glycerol-3-phosphate transport system substrate-binding protein
VNQPNVKKRIDKALNNFSSAKVEYLSLQSDSALQTLITKFNQAIYPDVMSLDGNWPYVLAERSIIAPLNNSTLTSDNLQQLQNWRQDAFPKTFEAGTYNNTLYAVPFGVAPYGLWYSKKLLRAAENDLGKPSGSFQPPKTLKELEEIMTELSQWGMQSTQGKKRVYLIGISTANTEPTFTGLWPWIWTCGGNPMRYDARGNVIDINWTDDGTLAAFELLRKYARNNWTPLGLSARETRSLMAGEQLIFKLENPSMHSYIIDVQVQQGNHPGMTEDPDNTENYQKDIDQLNQDFGVIPMPVENRLKYAPEKSVTVADVNTLAISTRTRSTDLAWQLIYFLTHDASNIREYQSKDGIIPPRKSYDKSFYKDVISQTFINDIIESPTISLPPYGPLYTLAGEFVISALSDIMNHLDIDIPQRLSQLNNTLQILYGL